MTNQKLEASSRVALTTLLHYLQTFGERAQKDYDTAGTLTRLLDQHLPKLNSEEAANIIDIASRKESLGGFVQQVIATADQLAKGVQMSANPVSSEPGNKASATQTRLVSLLESIDLNKTKTSSSLKYRQALTPLSPQGLFPEPKEASVKRNNNAAQKQYLELWQAFNDSLSQIPSSHQADLALWLDHFDTAWLTSTHTVPATTEKSGTLDVSLYDHSHTAAALATGLWRYHTDNGDDLEQAGAKMSNGDDGNEDKLLLIQGEFFGIQNFIFASGTDTRKRAAKLLRGRSLYVSLITECAALRVLESIGLPSTSQIINAAGKFLIVAPNTEETIGILETLQGELNRWFLQHSFGQCGLGLAWQPANANQFTENDGNSQFGQLMADLFSALATKKLQAFDLCSNSAPQPVFTQYLDEVAEAGGICAITGWGPGTNQVDGMQLSPLAGDQIRLGNLIAGKRDRLLLTHQPITESSQGANNSQLQLPLFGYYLYLATTEECDNQFSDSMANGNLRRLYDFALPKSGATPLWNGYARRAINGFVATFDKEDIYNESRYRNCEDSQPRVGEIKEFGHLACEDRKEAENDQLEIDQWVGIDAIGVLKGDVDDLGAIFQQGLNKPSFAKMASLSRQINNFFSVWLPWLCASKYPNTYTVFAGGDDFFLIGPWHSIMQLAGELRSSFADYVGNNPDVHFSAGLVASKPGLPIQQLSTLAEEALEHAKARHNDNGDRIKDGVYCFDKTLGWQEFAQLSQACEELEILRDEAQLSTGFIYGLLELCDMAADQRTPESALWRSRLNYRSWRHVERICKKDQQQAVHQRIVAAVCDKGIQLFGGNYRVALTAHLYLNRK